MLLITTLAFLIVGSGWAAALLLEGWILTIQRQTGDERVAIGAAVIALAAAAIGAGLLAPAARAGRSRRGRIAWLGGLAGLLGGAGLLAAVHVVPGLASHGVILGLAAHALLLIPGGLFLGAWITALCSVGARAGGRGEGVMIGLFALGVGGGILISPAAVLHDLGIGTTGFAVAGAALLVLAALAASRLVSPGATPPPGSDHDGSDPDDGRRIFSDAACASVGLGLGLVVFVVGRYGGILIPPVVCTWCLVVFLALAAFGAFVVLAALIPERFRAVTSALALAGGAVTAFLIAWDWRRLVEALAGLGGDPTAPAAAIPGPVGRETAEGLGLLLANGGGAAVFGAGAVCGLVLRGAQPDRNRGAPRRRGLAWIVAGAAAGVAAAAALTPWLEWQIWMIPAWLIGLGGALTALAARGSFLVRATLAILVIGALTFGLARDASVMNPTTGRAALTSICTPTAWVEVTELPGARTRERVRIDRRLEFVTASKASVATREREVELPLRLSPGAERVLILDETLGRAAVVALRPPETRVEVTWLVEGLGRYFGPRLASRARRSGREILLHSRPGRSVLAGSPGRFDVIVGLQPGGRTDRPVGPLTVEYMEHARSALRPGGVFCQWMRFDRLSPGELRSIARAFLQVFPRSASIVLPGLDPAYPAAGLIGSASDEPVRVAPLAPDARDGDVFPASLAEPLDVLAHFLAAAPLRDASSGTRAPTDGRPFARFDSRVADPETRRMGDLALYAALLESTATDSLPRIEGAGAPSAAVRDAALGAARELRVAHLARLEAAAGLGSKPDALGAALATCRQALERLPDRPFVWESTGELGRALLAAGLHEEARALFDVAMARAPEWAGGYLGKAMILFERHATFRTIEDWKPIESLAEKALELDHRLALAWIYLGIIQYRARHDADAARGCLEKAAMIDPDDPLLKSYLWLFIDRDGRTEEATRMLLDAVEAFPEEERLWDALYKQVPRLLIARKRGQALFVLRRIEPHYRDDGSYYLSLSEVLEAMGDLEGAVNAARKSCKLISPPVQGYYLHLYRLLKHADKRREAHELRGYMQSTFGVDPDELLAE